VAKIKLPAMSVFDGRSGLAFEDVITISFTYLTIVIKQDVMDKKMLQTIDEKVRQQKIIDDKQMDECKENPETEKITPQKKDVINRRMRAIR
jgi:hypothetical protein